MTEDMWFKFVAFVLALMWALFSAYMMNFHVAKGTRGYQLFKVSAMFAFFVMGLTGRMFFSALKILLGP